MCFNSLLYFLVHLKTYLQAGHSPQFSFWIGWQPIHSPHLCRLPCLWPCLSSCWPWCSAGCVNVGIATGSTITCSELYSSVISFVGVLIRQLKSTQWTMPVVTLFTAAVYRHACMLQYYWDISRGKRWQQQLFFLFCFRCYPKLPHTLVHTNTSFMHIRKKPWQS